MGLSADFKQLNKLLRATRELSKPKFLKSLNANLAQEALEQVDAGFAEQRSPYGKRWKRSIRAERESGQTLTDNARLRRSFSRQHVNASGFTIGTNVHYASTHQAGRVIRAKRKATLKFKIGNRWVSKRQVTIPQRQMVPEGDLGAIWGKALEDAAVAHIESQLR